MIKTAESVSPKHPDKLCDRISDAILDECLKQDPESRTAIEVMGGHGVITITGELTTEAYVDIPKIVHQLIGDKNYGVQSNIVKQSSDIAKGVDTGGAGDQGIMVGYACNETSELIPLEQKLARNLCQTLYKNFPFDGKAQVTIENGKVKVIVASFQNTKKTDLISEIKKWCNNHDFQNVEIFANPCGDWEKGGFEADTGLTGRKLVIDNYGPQIPIGGGCFSGKDSTKVDRSGAYMARKVAIDVLKKEKAKEVFVRFAYSIGIAEPIMVDIIVDGEIYDKKISYDLSPNGIIKFLDLKKPQFEKTAEWGHFGNGFKWDK